MNIQCPTVWSKKVIGRINGTRLKAAERSSSNREGYERIGRIEHGAAYFPLREKLKMTK